MHDQGECFGEETDRGGHDSDTRRRADGGRERRAAREGGQADRCGARGMGRQHGGQSGGGRRDAPVPELGAQFFQGAGHALLRRVVAQAERLADAPPVAFLEEPQQHGLAILGRQFPERVVQHRGQVAPGGIGFVGFGSVHGHGVFPERAAAFAPEGFGGFQAGVAMQPRGQATDVLGAQPARPARPDGEIGEDGLDDVLRQMGVAADSPLRGSEDQPDMALDQLPERRFGTGFGIGAQQIGGVVHVCHGGDAADRGKPTGYLAVVWDASTETATDRLGVIPTPAQTAPSPAGDRNRRHRSPPRSGWSAARSPRGSRASADAGRGWFPTVERRTVASLRRWQRR